MTELSSTELPVGSRPEDEKYSIVRTFLYGLQHILTMLGGIIAPPLIIGQAAGLSGIEIGILVSAGLLVSGLGTMLQTIGVPFFGSQLPVVQGISFVSVSTMVAVVSGGGGLPTIFGSIIVAGVIGLAIAPFFAQVIRFFPPVVTGTIITVIGVSLLPVAAGWMMGDDDSAADWGSAANIGLAIFTLVVILALSRLLQGPISRLSILMGLVIGTTFAAAVGMADFSEVGVGDTFALPTPFAFGTPVFEIGAIISMTVVIFIAMTETVADIIAVGEIVDSKVTARRVGDGLRSDMLTTVLAPVLNTFPTTTFSQNVGLVAITGIKSRWAVATGGSILVVLGLVPILGRVLASIPNPVLGGAGIVLFGSVAVAGIRTLSKVKYEGNLNLTLVATALALGVIPNSMPDLYSNFPTWFAMIFDSGISAAAIVAVVLNLLFNEIRLGRKKDPSVFTAGSSARLLVVEEHERRRAAYFAQLDSRLRQEHQARQSVERQARRRSGHGRRSGSAAALDRDADAVEDASPAVSGTTRTTRDG